MYNQIPNTAAAAKWIFFGFFGMILMAIVLGLISSDATWLNSDIASAQAERIQIESAHQEATYQLQEQLAAAKNDAEIRDIARAQALADADYSHKIKLLEQELAHNDIAFKTGMLVLTIIGATISLGIIIFSIAWTISRLSAKPAPRQPINVTTVNVDDNDKEDPVKEYWKERREWARDNEEWFRSATLMEARLKAAANSNSPDKERYDNLPLAI